MAADDIFGKSAAELTQQQDIARQKSLAVLIEQMKKKNMSPMESAGLAFGAQIGSGLAAALVNKIFPDPEIKKQKAIEEGMQEVDTTFQDNPDASPGENNAARLEAYRDKIGQYLSPKARLLLTGKIAAYRNDQFNQQRQLSADGRATTAAEDAHKSALAKLAQDEARARDAEKKLQFGGTPYEFELPDGSKRTVALGSDAYAQMLDLVDKGQAKMIGTVSERQNAENAQKLAEWKFNHTPIKPYVVPTAKLKEYDDMNALSILLNNIASPKGQAGLARSGGFTNVVDRLHDAFTNHFGTLGGMLDETSESAYFKTQTDKLRVVSQSLIKGVPSNADQAINELTNISTNVTPELNRMRISILADDAVDRVRAEYADFMINAAPNQPVPQNIQRAMLRLGIDANDIGTAEEEFARMSRRADERVTQVNEWKKAAGVSQDAHFDAEAGKWDGDPSTDMDRHPSQKSLNSSYKAQDERKQQNQLVQPNGTVIQY